MKSQPNISTVSALVDFKNVSDTAQAYSTSSTVITSLVKEGILLFKSSETNFVLY